MSEELLYEKGDVLVRRAILEPGESSPWHTDSCNRLTVILSGDRLAIEFRDSGAIQEFDAPAGQVDWDEPASEVHNPSIERTSKLMRCFAAAHVKRWAAYAKADTQRSRQL